MEVCSRSSIGGSSHSPSSVGDPDVHGQFNDRLGSPLSGPGCVRTVVSTGTSPAYEQHGVDGRIQSSFSLESLVSNKVVLVVTDNTTDLSYINKQGDEVRTATEMLVYFFRRGVEIRAKRNQFRLESDVDLLR